MAIVRYEYERLKHDCMKKRTTAFWARVANVSPCAFAIPRLSVICTPVLALACWFRSFLCWSFLCRRRGCRRIWGIFGRWETTFSAFEACRFQILVWMNVDKQNKSRPESTRTITAPIANAKLVQFRTWMTRSRSREIHPPPQSGHVSQMFRHVHLVSHVSLCFAHQSWHLPLGFGLLFVVFSLLGLGLLFVVFTGIGESM